MTATGGFPGQDNSHELAVYQGIPASSPPNRCSVAGCSGHLGKFADCIAEAVWTASLDGVDWTEQTGSTEYEGHYALMHFPEDEQVDVPDGPAVPVPAGWYLTITAESGAVDVTRYDTEEEARVPFAEADKRYGEWLEQNDHA
jgi:hypothetical protein